MGAEHRSMPKWALMGAYILCFWATNFSSMVLHKHSEPDAVLISNAFAIGIYALLPRPWSILGGLACMACGMFDMALFTGLAIQVLVFPMLNNLEAMILAALIVRARVVRLTTPGRVGRLLGTIIAPGAVVFAMINALATHLMTGPPVGVVFLSYLPAETLGLSLALPAVLLLARRRDKAFPTRHWFETASHFIAMAALSFLAFSGIQAPFFLMLFPIIALLGFRLGPRSLTVSLILCAMILTPMMLISAPNRLFDHQVYGPGQMLTLQIYIASLFFTGLTAALGAMHQHRLRGLFEARSASAMRARDRARAASAAKTNFLATMSHELRTPMNSIIGFSMLLGRRQDLPREAMDQARLIERSSGALLKVLNDILDFSKIDAGRIELDPKPTDLEALARDVVAITTDIAQRKGLALTMTVEGELQRAHIVDDHRLQQVLLNLLNNAVKFTDAGEVCLSLSIRPGADQQDLARFCVRDTGAGISPEAQERLFKRFSQVDNSISRRHGGTGLGLAISKGLVEAMGGTVGVDSALGQGSCFWLEIPMMTAEVVDHSETRDEERPLSAHVLLVDDHPINRQVGQAVLSLLGCTCELAKDGLEAVEAAKTGSYGVILMDLHMPGMDGLTACKTIRALNGPAASTPIIAMSADVMPEQIERCLAAGMVDSVSKPIDIANLAGVLARWVGRDSQGRALKAA